MHSIFVADVRMFQLYILNERYFDKRKQPLSECGLHLSSALCVTFNQPDDVLILKAAQGQTKMTNSTGFEANLQVMTLC
jgi:hypothetical protein